MADTNKVNYLCKYVVANFIIMKGEEHIILDPSNILSIEYLNDYEYHHRAMLKVTLRIDIRKRIWILMNKREILVKFEVNKVAMDIDTEEFLSFIEVAWNNEFGAYFNDDDESADQYTLESRLELNGGESFNINDIKDENYFETQNILDMYLFHPQLLKASKKAYNKIFTQDTIQNIIGCMLTETKHVEVLMSKLENDEVYKELILLNYPVYKNLIYLDQYYGLYKKGAIIYYDIDTLYILNSNGKVTAKRAGEWTETTFRVQEIGATIPGDGMLRVEGEKIFYPIIPEAAINPQKFSIGKNVEMGSEAKIVIKDDIKIDLYEADQSYINERNESMILVNRENKYTGEIVKARMEENECILYISGDNFDLNAFRPNKTFRIVFNEPLKQKKYGSNEYRLAYAYHFLKMEADYMNSSHRIILKKTKGAVIE